MRVKHLLLMLTLLATALPGSAQLLEQSDVLKLTSWRSHAGDNPAWANPNFDDSQWDASTPPTRSAQPKIQPGYRWYRTAVNLPASLQGRPLAIEMGPLDEVYEVFVDGISVGKFGHWNPTPAAPFTRNLCFSIPPNLLHNATVHIAVRRWLGGSNTNIVVFYALGTNQRHAPELGLDSTIQVRTQLYTANGLVGDMPSDLSLLTLLAAGAIAFVFFSTQRQRSEYLFLGIYCAGLPIALLCGTTIAASSSVMERSPLPAFFFVLYVCSQASALLFLSRVCPRIRHLLVLGAAADLISRGFGVYALLTQSVTADHLFWTLGFYPSLLFTVIASVALFLQRKPGSIAIGLAILVRQFAEAWTSLFAAWFHLPNLRSIPAGRFSVDIRNVFDVVMVSVILTVLYLRYREEQTKSAGLAQDMASARRMQQQLLSTSAENPAGFKVDAVYRPAKEVGGDFYKTELLDDGSLLIVVGDVSGKGLDAALLVAAVLGGLAIDLERRPASLLQHLNKAVLGRTGGGFITACCARLYPDGRLVVANAGHISPYRNGQELPVEAGLPLGIVGGISYSESQFQTRGATVTWLSDGVLEAQNPQGELLGFERMAALTTQPAAAIADAAQAWGQEDDITVLTVCNTAPGNAAEPFSLGTASTSL